MSETAQTETVERVAHALMEADGLSGATVRSWERCSASSRDMFIREGMHPDCFVDGTLEKYRRRARAAIETMREPPADKSFARWAIHADSTEE